MIDSSFAFNLMMEGLKGNSFDDECLTFHDGLIMIVSEVTRKSNELPKGDDHDCTTEIPERTHQATVESSDQGDYRDPQVWKKHTAV